MESSLAYFAAHASIFTRSLRWTELRVQAILALTSSNVTLGGASGVCDKLACVLAELYNWAINLRIGRIIASRQITSISAPDIPSVNAAHVAQSSANINAVRECNNWRNINSRACSVGSVTKTRFYKRRSIAVSRSHGTLLAAKTNTISPFCRLHKPSICTSSYVFILREPSCYIPSPDRIDMRQSISSMKMVLGA